MNVFLVILIVILIVILLGLPYKVDVVETNIYSKKVKESLTCVVLADVHDCKYGKDMSEIVDKVNEINPDIVLIPGDLYGEKENVDNAGVLLNSLNAYFVYFSSGNHEIHNVNYGSIQRQIGELGVFILDGKHEVYERGEKKLNICGVDDFCVGKDIYEKELKEALSGIDSSLFTILLSHHPEKVDLYKTLNCDLIVSGHAHGGHWKIPFTKKGLFAPGQGFFPKYSEGLIPLGKNYLYISRGLERGYVKIPRLYNNPEISVIRILPEDKDSA